MASDSLPPSDATASGAPAAVTPPPAAGRRLSYDRAPDRIRRWTERELGSGVVAAYDQDGGFSPGPLPDWSPRTVGGCF